MSSRPKARWGGQKGSAGDSRNAAACHKDVQSVAVGLAHEAYAALMTRNDWYSALKDANPGVDAAWLEKGWVNEHWGEFVEAARATMAAMLQTPIAEPLKDSIAEALIMDKQLQRMRAQSPRLIGRN